MEELLIKKIEAGIRKIRFGTTTPEEAKLGSLFNKLKPINPGMYEDLLNNYKSLLQKTNQDYTLNSFIFKYN